MANLREVARGRECQIRIPGVCNGNPETTVLCHLPSRGMGTKSHDLHGAWGCSDCHDCVDSRQTNNWSPELIKLWFLEGVIRTQERLIAEGLIDV